MHTVEFDGQVKPVAETWDELGPAQLPRVVAVLHGQYADAYQQKLELLEVLLGLNRPSLLRLSPVQLTQILWLTDFVLAGPVTRTRVPLPALRPAWPQRLLYAPADELANLSFLEFAFADAYFVAYATSQQVQYLDQLVAVLYRPQRARYRPHAADYAGDRRQPFNENLVEAHAARVACVSLLLKLVILTWYRGCRHALEQRYPDVFTPAGEEQAKAHPDGWAFVLREMSGAAFGSFAETGRQEAGQVLAKMNDDIALTRRQQCEQQARQALD